MPASIAAAGIITLDKIADNVVSPGAASKLYDASPLLDQNVGIYVKAVGQGYITVSIVDDDLIPQASETILDSGFDTAPLKDHDDDTLSNPATDPIPANTEISLARWDLGAIKTVFLRVKIDAVSGVVRFARLYISKDGSTWTRLLNRRGDPSEFISVEELRYIEIRAYNGRSSEDSAGNYKYYYVEAYDLDQCPTTINKKLSTKTQKRTLILAKAGDSEELRIYAVRGIWP